MPGVRAERRLYPLSSCSIGIWSVRRTRKPYLLILTKKRTFVFLITRDPEAAHNVALGTTIAQNVDAMLHWRNPFVDHTAACPDTTTSVLAFEVSWDALVGLDFMWRLTEPARLVLEAGLITKRVFASLHDVCAFYQSPPRYQMPPNTPTAAALAQQQQQQQPGEEDQEQGLQQQQQQQQQQQGRTLDGQDLEKHQHAQQVGAGRNPHADPSGPAEGMQAAAAAAAWAPSTSSIVARHGSGTYAVLCAAQHMLGEWLGQLQRPAAVKPAQSQTAAAAAAAAERPEAGAGGLVANSPLACCKPAPAGGVMASLHDKEEEEEGTSNLSCGPSVSLAAGMGPATATAAAGSWAAADAGGCSASRGVDSGSPSHCSKRSSPSSIRLGSPPIEVQAEAVESGSSCSSPVGVVSTLGAGAQHRDLAATGCSAAACGGAQGNGHAPQPNQQQQLQLAAEHREGCNPVGAGAVQVVGPVGADVLPPDWYNTLATGHDLLLCAGRGLAQAWSIFIGTAARQEQAAFWLHVPLPPAPAAAVLGAVPGSVQVAGATAGAGRGAAGGVGCTGASPEPTPGAAASSDGSVSSPVRSVPQQEQSGGALGGGSFVHAGTPQQRQQQQQELSEEEAGIVFAAGSPRTRRSHSLEPFVVSHVGSAPSSPVVVKHHQASSSSGLRLRHSQRRYRSHHSHHHHQQQQQVLESPRVGGAGSPRHAGESASLRFGQPLVSGSGLATLEKLTSVRKADKPQGRRLAAADPHRQQRRFQLHEDLEEAHAEDLSSVGHSSRNSSACGQWDGGLAGWPGEAASLGAPGSSRHSDSGCSPFHVGMPHWEGGATPLSSSYSGPAGSWRPLGGSCSNLSRLGTLDTHVPVAAAAAEALAGRHAPAAGVGAGPSDEGAAIQLTHAGVEWSGPPVRTRRRSEGSLTGGLLRGSSTGEGLYSSWGGALALALQRHRSSTVGNELLTLEALAQRQQQEQQEAAEQQAWRQQQQHQQQGWLGRPRRRSWSSAGVRLSTPSAAAAAVAGLHWSQFKELPTPGLHTAAAGDQGAPAGVSPTAVSDPAWQEEGSSWRIAASAPASPRSGRSQLLQQQQLSDAHHVQPHQHQMVHARVAGWARSWQGRSTAAPPPSTPVAAASGQPGSPLGDPQAGAAPGGGGRGIRWGGVRRGRLGMGRPLGDPLRSAAAAALAAAGMGPAAPGSTKEAGVATGGEAGTGWSGEGAVQQQQLQQTPQQQQQRVPVEVAPVVTYACRTLIVHFSDPALPRALGKFVRSDAHLMAMYESGLPTWAILLPSYGLWYRPWLRRVTWITSLLITIFSMACGFYDLYHNVPYLKQLVIWCFRPATSIFEWLEEHTQVRLYILLTYLFGKSPLFMSLIKLLSSGARLATATLQPLATHAALLLQPLWAAAVYSGQLGMYVVRPLAVGLWQVAASTGQVFKALAGPPAAALWGLVQLVGQLGWLLLQGPWQLLQLLLLPVLSLVPAVSQLKAAWQVTKATGTVAKAAAPTIGKSAAAAVKSGAWLWPGELLHMLQVSTPRMLRAVRSVLGFWVTLGSTLNRHRLSLLMQLRQRLQQQGQQVLSSRIGRALLWLLTAGGLANGEGAGAPGIAGPGAAAGGGAMGGSSAGADDYGASLSEAGSMLLPLPSQNSLQLEAAAVTLAASLSRSNSAAALALQQHLVQVAAAAAAGGGGRRTGGNWARHSLDMGTGGAFRRSGRQGGGPAGAGGPAAAGGRLGGQGAVEAGPLHRQSGPMAAAARREALGSSSRVAAQDRAQHQHPGTLGTGSDGAAAAAAAVGAGAGGRRQTAAWPAYLHHQQQAGAGDAGAGVNPGMRRPSSDSQLHRWEGAAEAYSSARGGPLQSDPVLHAHAADASSSCSSNAVASPGGGDDSDGDTATSAVRG